MRKCRNIMSDAIAVLTKKLITQPILSLTKQNFVDRLLNFYQIESVHRFFK